MERLAEPVERQRLDVILQVRRLQRRIGFREGAQLAGRHGQRPAPEQEILQPHADPPEQAVGALVQGLGVRDLEDQAHLQVVLEVAADAREFVHQRDAEILEQAARADAGELQELGRADGAARQDDLAPRRHIGRPALAAELDAECAAPVEADARRLGVGEDGQVRPTHDRAQEGFRCVPAHAALLVDVEVAAALVVAAVEVVGPGDADLGRGRPEGLEDLPAQAHVLDPPLAARAVGLVGALVEVLGAGEGGQHVVPAPAGVAELAPVVVVARLAAHVDHAVDRRAAAQHPAARIVERAAVEARLRLGLEAPVGPGVVLGVEVADRDVNPDVAVLAAGLEQADPVVRVRGQPVGEHAARRAGADDHGVELAEISFAHSRHPAPLPDPTQRPLLPEQPAAQGKPRPLRGRAAIPEPMSGSPSSSPGAPRA